jgi:RND family efflux transporter MFP subunit
MNRISMNRAWIVTLGLALLVPGLSVPGTAARAAEPQAAVVEVAPVTPGTGSAVLRLPGTVLSKRDAKISAEVTGRLTWVAEVGERIAEGEPLAIIDDHLLKLQLRNDWAEIERIKADMEYNQRQIHRLERLASQNNTSKSGLDEMQSRLQMLQQQLAIADIDRDRTVYDLGRARVRAPFSGVIVSREASVGEYTEPGAPLLRLVDTEDLEISVNAPLRVAHFNQPKSVVEVESGDLRLKAEIRAIVPVGDSRSRMMEMRLALEPGHWYIGEAVTVELADSAPETTTTVPRDALVLRDGEVYVYVISRDNTAVKVPVKTGAGRDQKIAVDGLLAPGDLVVVRGAERLRDGQPVKISQSQLAVVPGG